MTVRSFGFIGLGFQKGGRICFVGNRSSLLPIFMVKMHMKQRLQRKRGCGATVKCQATAGPASGTKRWSLDAEHIGEIAPDMPSAASMQEFGKDMSPSDSINEEIALPSLPHATLPHSI